MSTKKSHFWIGKFESKELFFDFIKEDQSRYELEDYDDVPISKFAKSQGEIFIDHDFMESGFEELTKDIKIQFEKYSYAYSWRKELELKCSKLAETKNNTLIFIKESEIEKPTSVSGDGFTLEYLGPIAYEI